MNGIVRSLERRWPRLARRAPTDCEAGFTALELITALAILSIVFTIVTSLFISFNQQSTNTQDSVTAVRQETQAGQTLVQYLRGASQVLAVYDAGGAQVGPSNSELDAVTSAGFNTSTYSSNCTNLDTLWSSRAARSTTPSSISPSTSPPPVPPTARGSRLHPGRW